MDLNFFIFKKKDINDRKVVFLTYSGLSIKTDLHKVWPSPP